MIGDTKARGKVRSTTSPGPEFKKKNSRGKSYKTIDTHKDEPDDSGDADTHDVAKRSTRGMRTGTGLPNGQGPMPYERKGRGGFKTTGAPGNSDSGCAVGAWCKGKRGSYK